MDKKLEMLEKLTGIQSSRKNYYVELTHLVHEMQRKNKQLEVLNQLTRIHVNMSWEEVTEYIAVQLIPVISFKLLVLTLVDRSSLSFYIAPMEMPGGTTWSMHRSWNMDDKLSVKRLNQLLEREFPDYDRASVLLRSHSDKAIGFLTMLSHHSYPKEEGQFFRSVADYAGVAIENILLYKDVCEKVKIEAQLIQSAKLAAIGEMAAGVAHELNSPLTAILGNTQLLLRETVNERSSRMLQDVYQCGVRSKRIIQNLLTFSRQDEYRFEEIDVDRLIDDVCSLIGYQLKVSGVMVEISKNPKLPPLKGSRQQIEQVLINLLLNARDALQDKENALIQIITDVLFMEGKSYITLTVHDNGSGIKEEDMGKIFHPFFTTKENLKGTGLGLSVSLGIIESHHGQIKVESKEQEYTQFTIMLPISSEEIKQ
ncbi:sensor histidine kinase [Ammoniphilus sp. YIM 78166]|uniref:sensor histidine kinase n=1 Tax=Ammoniphilus sp. YIM 78166 TaxID=1644106 RepID=UPI00106F6623|nr:ATP-binding protein [Ammoniphilus sp. YIM 78166]